MMKPLIWVGSTLQDLRSFPDAVRRLMGYALYLLQTGSKHPDAKALKGFGSARVLEVVDDAGGDTYRVVYTVTFPNVVYFLHAFQKTAKHGIATPKTEIDLIRARLHRAPMHFEQNGVSEP
jgi:phage-related protein